MDQTEDRLQIRKRLGRGLNVLLGDDVTTSGTPIVTTPIVTTPIVTSHTDAVASPGELRQIPVNALERNPFQPRTEFDDAALRELSDSIRQHGVLQPLLVRAASPGSWQLVAGERRWLAAQNAGLTAVPCRILELADQQVCEVALEENLKRKDLNVLEKAQAFSDYLQRFGRSVDELARQLSLDRSTVANMVRLLELSDAVKQALRADRISAGHARALLSLAETEQVVLCTRIQTESLSVRATESAVRELLAIRSADSETVPFEAIVPKKPKPEPTKHVVSLQNQLRDLLGVPVEIKLTGKESGQILLSFGSNDDFERVLRVLRRAA